MLDSFFLIVCWTHLPEACVNGNNLLVKHVVKSVTECKQLCAVNPKCAGIEHGGVGSHTPGDCLLHSSVNTTGCGAKVLNKDVYVKK